MTTTTKILLLSGIHGDEYEVILSIKKYLKNNNLSSFLYISKVSPSAVRKRTRNNINNIDLNRSFFDNSKDKEIIDLKQKLQGKTFFCMFAFHEDCDRKNEFYMYSSHNINTQIFIDFEKRLHKINVRLFDGIDDPKDPILNNVITHGLFISSVKKEEKGTLWPWLEKNNHIKHYVDFEIPAKASQKKKNELVQIIFDYLILRSTNLFLS